MLKIAVCYMSIGDEYRKWTTYSRENLQLYCKIHSYPFIEDDSVYDVSKPIPWSKLLLIKKYLSDYDYIVWIDADILIMNPNVKLENIIDKYPHKDIICGSCPRMINTGMLFVKNTAFSKEFLQAVFDNVYNPEEDQHERYKNWEQGSFINLYDKNHMECKDKIQIAFQKDFNSYWCDWAPGDFVLHGAGIRGNLLEYFLNKFVPMKTDMETLEQFKERMRYLAEDFRRDHDDMLKRITTENDIDDYVKKLKNNIVSSEEFIKEINKNWFHFETLLSIVQKSGEKLEGNCFYYHNTTNQINNGTNKQINLFSVARMGEIILEIVFNAGHSALLFLLANPNNKVYCFDICWHKYTKPCFEYLQAFFPRRVFLYPGNSIETIRQFKTDNPDMKFDVVHVDGCHDPYVSNIDFFQSKELSKRKGILIFDDVDIPALKDLWDGYVRDRHVREINLKEVLTYPHAIGLYL